MLKSHHFAQRLNTLTLILTPLLQVLMLNPSLQVKYLRCVPRNRKIHNNAVSVPSTRNRLPAYSQISKK